MRNSPLYEVLATAEYFENQRPEPTLLTFLPTIVRLDGKNFSRLTKPLRRPYDIGMSRAMVSTAEFLIDEFKAKMAYTVSDEITLYFEPQNAFNIGAFGGRLEKLLSIYPATCSVYFYKDLINNIPAMKESNPVFDAKIWQVPDWKAVSNAFLARMRSGVSNALSMAACNVYTSKELEKKNYGDRIQLLAEKGIDFSAYHPIFRKGTFIRRQEAFKALTDEEWNRIPDANKPESRIVARNEIVEFEVPEFKRDMTEEDLDEFRFALFPEFDS